ncbi:hypothetical protein IGB42_00375 [Andreprevotia sp. IGB-42]|uniref:DUF4150 domain-containing protein n=1 Tax=Andreprevotia sp. IGB-42 TaxID=2497473 RepID=UPI001356E6E0|nr:DUF4150 domain-containing protein [Andreprevotia sp. IGB-42]KAF0815294.1 hypothetical protein IGB42_00375 [Andreprevotia sp. IGB-42]
MFANTNLGVMNFAFPDVCKVPTPVGPIPLPFPNIALSFFHIPSQFQVIIDGGLAENLLTEGTISRGDFPGVLGGIISNVFMGPDRQVLGSFKVLMGGIFGTRLTTLTLQNGEVPNAPGLSITPAQFRVILLG